MSGLLLLLGGDGSAASSMDPRTAFYRLALLVSSFLFLLGLRGLSNPETARRGMMQAAVGMLLGVVGTLVQRDIVHYHWIAGGLVLGTVIGAPMGLWIPMTKMPERIALSHAFGGLAVALVGVAEYLHRGATIGKFANIAAHVRIYASRHPMQLASLHHFTYRSSWYFDDAEDNQDFFDWRESLGITIGHDTWIGHGAVIMPGVTVGNGSIIGSNAVVTRDVPPYSIAVGVPAKVIKSRFDAKTVERLEKLSWWDWPHEVLRERLGDFRTLPAEEFLDLFP